MRGNPFRRLGTLLLLAAFTLMAGCAGIVERIEHSPRTSQGAVMYGTLKYTGDDAEKAQRVYDRAGEMRAYIDTGESVTIGALDAALRERIRWDRLDLADRMLLDLLLAELRDELERRWRIGELSPDEKVALGQVVTWIQDAAVMAGARGG